MAARRTPLAKEILRKSGQFDSESVQRANLASFELVSLAGVDEFTSLVALCLDDNKLTSLQALKDCTHLQVLSARNNNIMSIGKLPALPDLTDLDLSGNSIDSLSSLAGLSNFSGLKRLQLKGGRGNAVCKLGAYEEEVMVQLPALEELDGCHVAVSKVLRSVPLLDDQHADLTAHELEELGVPPPAAWLPGQDLQAAAAHSQAAVQTNSPCAAETDAAVAAMYDVSSQVGVQIVRVRKLLAG